MMHIEISNEARITGSPDLKSLARLLLTVPKFAISQSEANSTVLISYCPDILRYQVTDLILLP